MSTPEYDYTPYAALGGVTIYRNNDGDCCGVYANNFEKQSEKAEELNKVSVVVVSADAELKIYVDTDGSDGMNNDMQLVSIKEPDDDSIAYSLSEEGTSIYVPYPGNYVFELEEPLVVADDFTVAIDASSSDGYPVAYETSYSLDDGSYFLKHKFIDKSYVTNSINNSLYNLNDLLEANDNEGNTYECDLMIRAYTAEVDPVNVTVDEDTYEADYGTALSDFLSDNNITDTVYEAVSGEENSYKPADRSTVLTEDITLCTGTYILAPTMAMTGYQASTDGEAIRFVGEITDEFDEAVEKVIALGFVYSKDGDTDETKIECSELYESLEDYEKQDGVYLFKSDELEAANYTVSAYIKYSLNSVIRTVYTEKKTVSGS